MHKIPQQCLFFKYRNIHTQNLKYITALDKRKIKKKEMNSSIVPQWKSHTHIQTRKCVWVEENYNCKKKETKYDTVAVKNIVM